MKLNAEFVKHMAAEKENSPIKGRDKIKQVFKYLSALHDHRNPAKRQVDDQPWHLWFDDLPTHAAVQRGSTSSCNEATETVDTEQRSDDVFIFSVDRPKLVPAPSPPADLLPWLKAGWERPQKEVVYLEEREIPGDDGVLTVSRFDECPDRVELFATWLEERGAWRERELPAYHAMDVFQRLYELHGRVEREGERFELVVGDGILSWSQSDCGIFHPVLIRRVQLEFDAHVPSFRIVDLDQPTELYTSIFQSIGDVDGRAISNCRQELEASDYHPLSQDAAAFLKRFSVMLSPDGVLLESGRPIRDSKQPQIGRSPVLFLRSRAQSFARAIEQLLGTLESRDEFCQGLLNIVGTYGEVVPPSDGDETSEITGRDELPKREVLFTKKANAEQEQIAQRLDQHGAVLVQGPPGTGKSHTIANLIGHLLANGRSVLVTSHTTKALRVLRDHVVEELRPLCVSVLDSDLESRQQLAQSVEGISRRLSESDAEQLGRDAEQLNNERNCLLDKLDQFQSELHHAVTDEYRAVIVAGKEYSPTDAAKIVAAGRDKNNWIPGPVTFGEPLPLSVEEVLELYATNGSTTADDDCYVNVPLPRVDELRPPLHFRQWVDGCAAVEQRAADTDANGASYWIGHKFKSGDIAKLKILTEQIGKLAAEFHEFDAWKVAAISTGNSRSSRDVWEDLLGKIDEAKVAGELAETARLRHNPQLADNAELNEQRRLLLQIIAYHESGGRLGILQRAIRPAWRKAMKSWRINDASPNQIDHFRALEAVANAAIVLAELTPLWDGLIGKRGGKPIAELGEYPERFCAQQSDVIRELLDWSSATCQPAITELQQFGFQWQRFVNEQPPRAGEHGELLRRMSAIRDRLPTILDMQIRRLDAAYGQHIFGTVYTSLQELRRPEVQRLCDAIRDRSPDKYESAYDAIEAATTRRVLSLRRDFLLRSLESPNRDGRSLAGAWAIQIRNRTSQHSVAELPGDVSAAWEWRQLHDELEKRAAIDVVQLGSQIAALKSQIEESTKNLVDRRAWANQVGRLNAKLRLRQSLIGWLDTYRKIGKGFGKMAAKLKQAAQEQMNDCRDAVPVWIMPLSRVVENFDFSDTVFDVVIIDEASQCDAMGLLALAIARSVVVVGDHMQVSPLAVGQKLDVVHRLISEHLQGIPNSVLYDGTMSIYDLARQSFGGAICLTEHFRCVPDIIQFSNALSYDFRIKPLREDGSSPLTPHVVPYRVEGAKREGDVNREEALTIASLIAAAVEHPAYSEQTVGVVTLVGDGQALEIQRLLEQHLEPDEMKRRRILCGNPAHFQGDERHVMFLSMVDVADGDTLTSDGTLRRKDDDRFKQRFNVAASRARNQMWVVYSVDHVANLKAGDLRRRLIEHVIDPKAVVRDLEEKQHHVESEFERQVLEKLIVRQYRVTPQWKVGNYRIDLVVIDGNKRLAIECDGDRFHPPEKLKDDLQRQAILERLGWKFIRLRGSEFFRSPDATMERVFDRLNALGIGPTASVDAPPTVSDDSIIETVKRRAAEIRREWRPTEPEQRQNTLFA